MVFSKLIKKIDTNISTEQVVDINQIKAQYNPDRFRFWKSLHNGPKGEELNMIYSPHYKLLNGDERAYYKMQKLYGKNDKWIRKKIIGFYNLYSSICEDGIRENIIILNRPLVKNKYNNGFELYEGHHRLACCLVLGMKETLCKVIGEDNGHN